MTSPTTPNTTGPGPKLEAPAHTLSAEQVVSALNTNIEGGLTPDSAASVLAIVGPNELEAAEGVNPLRIIAAQIANAMTLILIIAMVISYAIKSYIEATVIAFVILLNIVVGTFQEYSAAKTMDSLRSLSSPTATVIRGFNASVVPSAEIVPGDLIELKTGDTLPADIRLVTAVNFETDEALLTGESLPARKSASAIVAADMGPGDQINMGFSSTTVTKGRATGIVVATGAGTEIGKIAAALSDEPSHRRQPRTNRKGKVTPYRHLEAYTLTLSDALGRFLGVNVGTPLQRKLSKLAIVLFGCAVVCALIVLGANKFDASQEVIIYAVATGLSMIPASLVVVLTITMAAGTKRMVKRNVIVRNLRSLEALGAVTDICSDKTGTLTQGKMLVRAAWVAGSGTYTVDPSDRPFDPTDGAIRFSPTEAVDVDLSGQPEHPASPAESLLSSSTVALPSFLRVAALANLATVIEKEGEWHAHGDPTEIALEVFSTRFGMNRLPLTQGESPAYTSVAELPFDSDVKRMSVVVRENATGSLTVLTKGAVERVLDACETYQETESSTAPITEEFKEKVLTNMTHLASAGLRVLAIASAPFTASVDFENPDRATIESGLTLHGLIALYDPPRPSSAPAVNECHTAGIAVHMLTGDHPATATSIARTIGILPSSTHRVAADVAKYMVLTAAQFDALSDEEVDAMPVLPLVIARCTPQTKVRMIQALHRRGKFVAMTGDGVNDSPSLRYADVGIAMGLAGSDVAKDASDIVLADDNFASIVAAIEEGRRIFDNIQKFVLHVLAENIAQAGTLLVGLAFKDGRGLSVFPLAPVEIVWIIMATSGMPDMGLGFQAAVPNIMKRPPQSLTTGIFTTEFLVDMVVYGLWITGLCLGSFSLVMYAFGDGNFGNGCNDKYNDTCDTVFRARATTFACLTWFALFLAWEMLDLRRSFFRMQPKSTKYFTQWMYDIWANKFLLGAVLFGFVTLFPLIYIPVINTVVFKHKGISWEWGIVFIAAALFFAGVEAWKWAKRVFYRRQARKEIGVKWKDMDLEERVFADYFTQEGSGAISEKTTRPVSEKVEEEDQAQTMFAPGRQ